MDIPETTSSLPSTNTPTEADSQKLSLNEGVINEALREDGRSKLRSYEEYLSDTLNDIHLLPVRLFLCHTENSQEHCVEVKLNNLPQPVYTSGVCHNITSSVQYVFEHNGTEGFTDVRLKVYLTSVSDTVAHLTQNFRVQYVWASTRNSAIFERSGRPGYLTGKPILLGKLVDNTTEEGKHY